MSKIYIKGFPNRPRDTGEFPREMPDKVKEEVRRWRLAKIAKAIAAEQESR